MAVQYLLRLGLSVNILYHTTINIYCAYRTLTNDRFYSAPAHRMRSGSCENVELDFFQPPKSGCPSFDRFMKGVEHMSALFKTIMSLIFGFLLISW